MPVWVASADLPEQPVGLGWGLGRALLVAWERLARRRLSTPASFWAPEASVLLPPTSRLRLSWGRRAGRHCFLPAVLAPAPSLAPKAEHRTWL